MQPPSFPTIFGFDLASVQCMRPSARRPVTGEQSKEVEPPRTSRISPLVWNATGGAATTVGQPELLLQLDSWGFPYGTTDGAASTPKASIISPEYLV